MYIQNNNATELPFSLPKGYRGSAFSATPPDPVPPKEQAPESPVPPPPSESAQDSPTAEAPPEAAEAFAPHCNRAREGGIFTRLPFLSSLLPPPRQKHGERGGLPEWAVLGIVLLLLLDSPENDLLPFLLILLLWD
jgi:hypothetical protein